MSTPEQPGTPEEPRGPQSPAPGPQSPAPGPQSPAPGPQSPGPGPLSPAPGPQSPQSPGPGAPPAPGQPPGGTAPPPPPPPPGGFQQAAGQYAPTAPLASWGSRVGATLIDGVILLIPMAVLGGIVFAIAGVSDSGAIATLLVGLLVGFVVFLAYAPVLMARQGENNGQTWGKQILGIRVSRDDGQPVNFGYAALREVVVKWLAVSIASSIIPLLPWLLDVLWPLWDDQNRALHDMIVKSHVVNS